MHVARVVTHRTCNQNCKYCVQRAARDDPAFVSNHAVVRRIVRESRRLSVQRGGELILRGGEPLLRRHLPALVALAKRSGAGRVAIETNGTLLTSRKLESLLDAGLGRVYLHVPAWGKHAYEQRTREPGSFDKLLDSLQLFGRFRVPVVVVIPVLATNVASLAELPGRLLDTAQSIDGLTIESIRWRVPRVVRTDACRANVDDAVEAMSSASSAAAARGLICELEPGQSLPPCLFHPVDRYASLFSLSPGGAVMDGYVKRPLCSQCKADDRCPGAPSWLGDEDFERTARPITSGRTVRRLSRHGALRDQVDRELYQDEIRRLPNGERYRSRLIRTNFSCNQDCEFCFVATHLPNPRFDRVLGLIEPSARQGDAIVLSGGEPTLNPHLFEFVRAAVRRGADRVELQTNATRLAVAVSRTHPAEDVPPAVRDSWTLADALARAGLDTVFVSLHAATADVSDRVTRTPGSFEQTVAGLDAAVSAGLEVRINFVLCARNYRQFPDFVRLVARRWPRATIVVSFIAPSSDVVPQDENLIPRYRDVMPWLRRGLLRARERSIAVSGFDSMCGIPLCLLPKDLVDFSQIGPIGDDDGGGEFVRAKACESCSLRDRCFGIRRRYARLYGLGEFGGGGAGTGVG